jgi:GH15 family glucan-1,4-alpha-glucosidase
MAMDTAPAACQKQGSQRLMPRDIPVGNGRLLVTCDHHDQIRDVYFPHVGQENHAGAGPCRFGVYTDVPHRHRGQLFWTTDHGWAIRQRYLRDTLTTSVSLDHRELKLAMYCNDVVDFHRPIYVRKIKIKNLASYDRTIKLMHHQDFNMFGTKVGSVDLLAVALVVGPLTLNLNALSLVGILLVGLVIRSWL